MRGIRCAAILAVALAVLGSQEAFASSGLRRGINVYPWSGEARISSDTLSYEWPPFQDIDWDRTRRVLELLRVRGFDFIRLPIEVGPLLFFEGKNRETLYKRTARLAGEILKRDYGLILDLHPGSLGPWTYQNIIVDSERRARFREIALGMASIVKSIGNQNVLLELMNEPTDPCDSGRWIEFQRELIKDIRAVAKDIQIITTGTCWSKIDGLNQLEIEAANVSTYYTFHYYSPDFFTHQGATWRTHLGLRALTGLPWPASAGNMTDTIREIDQNFARSKVAHEIGADARDQAVDLAKKYFRANYDSGDIEHDFDRVAAWADRNKIPRGHVILGEFGVLKRERHYMGADLASAARWLETVRKAAERRGFPWAMWNYTRGMALTKSDTEDEFYPELIEALGLQSSVPKPATTEK